MQKSSGIAADLASLATPIERLSPLPGNPRVGDIDAVARSYSTFGQRKPIVARRSGVVIAGNHQLAAALKLGWSEIAVVFVDDDDVTANAYALADNKTAELGTYNEADLVALLSSVQQADAELFAATAWTDAELEAMLDEIDVVGFDPSADDAVFSTEMIVDSAFEHFRAAGFPWPSMPSYAAMQEINTLAVMPTADLVGTTCAYHVADPYQRHRFETRIPGKNTVLDTFEHDVRLKHACKFTLDSGGKLTPASLRNTLALTRNAQLAAQFRPGFALHLYRRFAPPGAVVLDTSTGYGGRLVGFIASHCDTYIGIDPEPRTCAGNRALVEALCPAHKHVEIIEQPVEDVEIEPLRECCDFAFTSPPYFGKERYSEDDTQSAVRYVTPAAWRTGFLDPMMRLQYAALRHDTYAVLNVADVKVGKDAVPLIDWSIEAALAAGFEHVRTERFPLPRVPGNGEAAERFEPLLIFRKE